MRGRKKAPTDLEDNQTGSPLTGEPVFLAIGFLRRPHGLKGEILMDVLTDFPERLGAGKEVYISEAHKSYRIAHVRKHDQKLLISLEGVADRDQAGTLRNQPVYIRQDALPALEEGAFYFHELFGLAVIDEQGELLGTLEEILETGANDVYLVRSAEGQEILLPAIDNVILNIDRASRVMHVRLPEWL
jgi:16S rRNA processing protein RimM